MRRLLGIFVLLCTALAVTGQCLTRPGHTVRLPTVSWVFEIPLQWGATSLQSFVGWVLCAGFALLGIWLLKAADFPVTPMTSRKLKRFTEIGRGWWSFRILLFLVFLACLDQVIVGRRALAVRYEGAWFFPAFREEIYTSADFGESGADQANYRKLAEKWQALGSDNTVILPLIPWDATYDTDENVRLELETRDGVLLGTDGRPYSGLAQSFSPENPTVRVRQARFRNGLHHLNEEGFDAQGMLVYSATWEHGKKIAESPPDAASSAFLQQKFGPWVEIDYMPIQPNRERGHYLGTDSRGWDVAAQLYGGFQVILKASLLYLAATYAIGISLGLLMGFRGGVFDLILQRVIEILSSVPFIYIVIILVSIWDRDRIGLSFLIAIHCLFSWIGCSHYLRTATFREKARDYVAAARVMGASSSRIIFKHILPNTLSVLVTLIPFSITGISTSLTSLDFIGFGLPERYASWGRLLSDGVENLRSAPWIVTSVFAVLVGVLLLVTFVGEALREAFDPKKFTTYR